MRHKEERVMEKINFTEERRLKAAPGMLMLFVSLIVTLLGIPAYIAGFAYSGPSEGAVLAAGDYRGHYPELRRNYHALRFKDSASQ